MESNDHGNTAAGYPMREGGLFRAELESAGAQALARGARFSEFEIVGLIDQSDIGITYLAYDHAAQRDATILEYLPARLAERGRGSGLAPRSGADAPRYAAGLNAFLSEARLLSRFDSPFLVRILRFWEANGTGYMAMPFYQGMLLREAAESGRIQPNEGWIKSLLDQLFDPLEQMHAAHCYHPGIAPDNILLRADGQPLLLDFGAARRALGADAGSTLRDGAAPIEEYDDIPNLKPGPWTDVYALAAVAYFLVAGKMPPPAPARLASDAMEPAWQAGAGRYSVPFLAALDQALAVRPEQRFQSIAEFRRDLGLRPGARQAMPPLHAARTPHGDARTASARAAGMRRGSTGSRRAAWTAALLALAVLAAGGYWHMRRQEAAPPTIAAPAPPTPAASAPTATQSAATPSATAAPAPAPAAADASKAEAPAPTAEASAAPAGNTREDAQWLLASSLNNAAAYEAYLRDYPNGRFAPIARAALERIRTLAAQAPAPAAPAPSPAQEEDRLWQAVRNIDMPLAYESFLEKYPNGRHAATARAKLAQFRMAAAEQRTTPVRPQTSPQPPASRAEARAPASGAESNALAAPEAQAPRERLAAPAASPRSEPPDTDNERDTAAEPPPARSRTLRLPNQIMTGDFTPDPVTGLVSGRGRIVWDNGDQFDGSMVRGQKEGRGEFRWANGQRYRGDWARDQPNGKGTIQYPNGDRYTGDMRAGLPNGSGTLSFVNGNRYRGEVRDGLPQGGGVNRYNNGDVYSGAWNRGKAHGQGRYTWANGDYWEGEFSNDAQTGNGRLVTASGDNQGGGSPAARRPAP